jgi:hypothetical protein
MRFLKSATGNSLDADGAITMAIINNAMEIAKSNGANGISLLLCHPTQARKISAFNTS